MTSTEGNTPVRAPRRAAGRAAGESVYLLRVLVLAGGRPPRHVNAGAHRRASSGTAGKKEEHHVQPEDAGEGEPEEEEEDEDEEEEDGGDGEGWEEEAGATIDTGQGGGAEDAHADGSG